MDKHKENTFKFSYESDGKMGKKDTGNTKKKKNQAELFFNNTQDSE